MQLKVKETWPTKRASAVIMAIHADTFSPSTSQDAPEITLFTILDLFFSVQVPIVLVRKLIRLKVYYYESPRLSKVITLKGKVKKIIINVRCHQFSQL